ncbi:hypothetical protein BT67DRAFT_364516, partial [Trichocladium antarcticum]
QIAYFRAIPWCAAHLTASPNLIIAQSVSRELKPPSSNLDALFSRTLNTPDAIPAYITLHLPPPSESQPSSSSSSSSNAAGGSTGSTPTLPALVTEVKSLVALGPMVNGWDGICHGGMVVTLLDEVMGQFFSINRDRGALGPAGMGGGVPVMTGYLNTRFEKPVLTGGGGGGGGGDGVVMVVARLVRREGRKFFLEGEVSGEGGVVMARAESLFVMAREKL